MEILTKCSALFLEIPSIEVFYNRKRRHSASGMMSPANFETFRKVA